MKTLAEVSVKTKYNDQISLSKLTGQPVTDVLGYISCEFGEPSFKITKVVLADGKEFWAEGEHDHPYLTDGTAEFDEEQLQFLYDEENT